MQVADATQDARVPGPAGGPLGLGCALVQDPQLEVRGVAQRDPQLLEECSPALVGKQRGGQFQRLGPRSSTRRPRQYFTLSPPPPPRVP